MGLEYTGPGLVEEPSPALKMGSVAAEGWHGCYMLLHKPL